MGVQAFKRTNNVQTLIHFHCVFKLVFDIKTSKIFEDF